MILSGTKFCKTVRKEVRSMQTNHPNVRKLSGDNLIFPPLRHTPSHGAKVANQLPENRTHARSLH